MYKLAYIILALANFLFFNEVVVMSFMLFLFPPLPHFPFFVVLLCISDLMLLSAALLETVGCVANKSKYAGTMVVILHRFQSLQIQV